MDTVVNCFHRAGMAKRRQGKIVFTSSPAALITVPYSAGYSAKIRSVRGLQTDHVTAG
jgi:short-subunit dehydrogenase